MSLSVFGLDCPKARLRFGSYDLRIFYKPLHKLRPLVQDIRRFVREGNMVQSLLMVTAIICAIICVIICASTLAVVMQVWRSDERKISHE